MNWMFMPLKRYVDFQGRSGRKEFWFYVLFVSIVVTILYILMGIMLAAMLASMTIDPETGVATGGGGGGAGVFLVSAILWIFLLGTMIPSIAVAVRRMHDQDKSGWFMLIPIYNIVLYCMPGTPGPNRFGTPPAGDGSSSQPFN